MPWGWRVMAKHGSHVGRKTKFGQVTGYTRGLASPYQVTCGCGEIFSATSFLAREGNLSCYRCFRELQKANGAMASTAGKAGGSIGKSMTKESDHEH